MKNYNWMWWIGLSWFVFSTIDHIASKSEWITEVAISQLWVVGYTVIKSIKK